MCDRIQAEYECVPGSVYYSIHNAWGRERQKQVTHRLQCSALIAGNLRDGSPAPKHPRCFSADEQSALISILRCLSLWLKSGQKFDSFSITAALTGVHNK